MVRSALLLMVAFAVIGCGTGSTDEDSRYVTEMRRIQEDENHRAERLGAAMLNSHLPLPQWSQAAHGWLDEQTAALQELRAVDPPSDVAELHNRYVEATATWLGSMRRLIAAVEEGRTARGSFGVRAERLEAKYVENIGPLAEAIEGAGYDVVRPFA